MPSGDSVLNDERRLQAVRILRGVVAELIAHAERPQSDVADGVAQLEPAEKRLLWLLLRPDLLRLRHDLRERGTEEL